MPSGDGKVEGPVDGLEDEGAKEGALLKLGLLEGNHRSWKGNYLMSVAREKVTWFCSRRKRRVRKLLVWCHVCANTCEGGIQ